MGYIIKGTRIGTSTATCWRDKYEMTIILKLGWGQDVFRLVNQWIISNMTALGLGNYVDLVHISLLVICLHCGCYIPSMDHRDISVCKQSIAVFLFHRISRIIWEGDWHCCNLQFNNLKSIRGVEFVLFLNTSSCRMWNGSQAFRTSQHPGSLVNIETADIPKFIP